MAKCRLNSEDEKIVSIQLKHQASNGKDAMYLINFFTRVKRAYYPSQIHEGAAVWFF